MCANGSIGEAMGLGIEVADTASRITGNQTMFVAPVVGAYAAVAWLTGVSDLATFESANAALRANDEWLKLVDQAGHAFQPDVTTSLLRRSTDPTGQGRPARP